MADPTSQRQRALRRLSALKLERSTWWGHWREINEVLLPRSGQFFVTQANKGTQRNQAILDNTSTRALTTLAAGMHSGLTSPARPWLKLETQNPDLMEVAAVSQWLDQVTQRMLTIFQKSNTYKSLHNIYFELGAYGTAANVVLPDFDNVIHHWPLTVGEYAISTNERGVVDTMAREYQMTVGQIVKRYVFAGGKGKEDWSKVSPTIKNLWDRHQHDSWVPVFHVIEPREDRDLRKLDSKNMPFSSCIYEAGGQDDLVLNESGFRRFPVLVPRWRVSGHDIYGSDCPGMVALGDIQQLQQEQLSKARAIEYQTNPPLQVPSTLKNTDSDFLPGGITFVDQAGPQNAVRTAFDLQFNLQHLHLDLAEVRQRINAAFFADVFLSLSNSEGMPTNMTAREIAERHEEKMLMLGPVVEGVQDDLLDPLVDITFDAAMEAGIFPPAPPELSQEGAELKVQYTSILAQAQRSIASSGVDRILGFVGNIAQAKQDPGVWDKIDVNKAIDKAASYIGVDPEIIRGEDEVAQMAEQRQQAQAAQQKLMAAQQMADTAKTASQADLSGENGLTALMNR